MLKRFDVDGLYLALDSQRVLRGLSWAAVAREFWHLDAALNELRPNDHPFSASTIKSMRESHRTSCQHALFMLRWLDRSPECFLVDPPSDASAILLPQVPPGRRLRWSLRRLHDLMDDKRTAERMTWTELALVLGCKPNQLTGLRSAKFATGIELAMRIVQWTGRRSTDFMRLATW